MCEKIVRRIRPYLFLPDATVHGHPFQDHSFPSGHTTAIFSITVPFMVVEPLLLLFLLPISMMVALSRVVLGVHYPTDTAVGALIGTLSSFVVAMLLV
ncbi:phosphatase PAP2 family protein [Bacillus coahuilensis]|uniref:phosphatase PAP2 family protein n=1 Tax=Bacillus coahuilensis TaxID=408580 RepID=UPI0001850E2C|nr:phosphatase PAP2 family protein [Bacillus coahuilensis]